MQENLGECCEHIPSIQMFLNTCVYEMAFYNEKVHFLGNHGQVLLGGHWIKHSISSKRAKEVSVR